MDEKLLIKFISGKANLDEQSRVFAWIEESEKNKSTFASLKNLTVATNLLAVDYSKKNSKKRLFTKALTRWSIGAAALLILSFSVFNYGKHNEKKSWIESSKDQITKITAPMGECVCLTLPDGTAVKLNSGSYLEFSKLFGYKDRTVIINGEGYFEVNKNDKNFIVKTSDLDVIVLGTTFNICAYKDDNFISVSLFEGQVKISNQSIQEQINLNPNDTYTFNKGSKKSQVKSANRERDWIDNYFSADCDNIETFAKKIERKYKVKIIISPELIGQCVYTGSFRGETLKEILENMSLASPIKYQIKKDNTVIISPKNL